jgi:hypothetical protein
LTLDGGELVADAKQEMEQLRSELREMLDATTYDKLAALQAEQSNALNATLQNIPLLIYVG